MDDLDKWTEEARKGSPEAFCQLVRVYQSRVRAYLSRYLHDKDVADDLAQDVFLRAYKSIGRYKGEAPLGIWFLAIARNLVLKHFRDESRHRSHDAEMVRSALAGWFAQAIESETVALERRE